MVLTWICLQKFNFQKATRIQTHPVVPEFTMTTASFHWTAPSHKCSLSETLLVILHYALFHVSPSFTSISNFIKVGQCYSGSACPHGQHLLIDGTCDLCPPGKYSHNSSCIECDKGKFISDSGHSSCLDCPINSYSDQTGSTVCKSCPKQSFSTALGATTLSLCKVQHCDGWKEINSSFFFVDSTKFASWYQAQRSCNSLKHGSRLAVLNSQWLIDKANETFPVGDFDTFWIGLREIDHVENYLWMTGENFNLNISEAFYQGYIDHSGNYTQHCIELFYGRLNDDYCYASWNFLCELPSDRCFKETCPVGSFLNVSSEDFPVCSLCPPGLYQNEQDMLTCNPCDLGKYGDRRGQTTCTPCELGKYADTFGLTSCVSCPSKGRSSTAISNSRTSHDCYCIGGFYGKAFEGEGCNLCDEVYSCPFNSTKPQLKSGYFLDTETGGVYQCKPLDSCLMTDSFNHTTCGEGYTGFACGSCIPLQYYRSGGACFKCGSEGVKWALFVLGFSFLSLLIYRLSTWKGNIPLDIRIMFMSLQIIAMYPNIANDWPSNIAALLKVTSVGNFDLDLVSPGNDVFGYFVHL
jgi:hypothetical protein